MKQSSVVNLVLVLSVLFTVAFGCKNGNGPVQPSTGNSTEKKDRLTKEIVEQQIREQEEAFAGRGGVISVSLSFETIEIGQPQEPSYQDKIDGITSETFYPVRTKFTRIRKQASGDLTQNYDRNYKFFKDSHGQWRHVYGTG